MTGTIHPDQIKGFKLFDSASQPRQLCGLHEAELSEEIATDVNDLVQSRFFQEKFGSLFPEDLTGAHFNIRLKDHTLIVQLMRKDALDNRLTPEGRAVAIDLTAPADEDVIEINGTILDKADALFRKCHNEHIPPHRSASAPSLRGRATDLTYLSDDDLLDELAARRQHSSYDPIDDLFPNPRRIRSISVDRLERRTRTAQENPADTLRSSRQAQIDLQLQAERLSRRPDVTIEQLAPLHEQIRSLEQQIQRLSEQLGIPTRTTAATVSDAAPLLERIFDRLARIEDRLSQFESSRSIQSTPPPSEQTSSFERPDRTSRREEDTRHRRTLSDPTERSSQREADLEDALRRVRQDYLNLQREAGRLARRPDASIDQLAPLHEHIRRLEQQIQLLSEQLGIPARTTVATGSDSTPLVERIFERLASIEESLKQFEGPRPVQSTTPPPTSEQTSSLGRPDCSSQREAGLEDALHRARQAYLDLQQEAERLSRRPDASIDQLAPLHEHILRLEQQIQRLSEQLGTPLMTATTTVSTPAPILDRIHDRLSRIDEHLRQLEGPTIVPEVTTPSSDRVDALERQRAQLEDRLADVTSQIDRLRERNLELSSQLASLIAPSPNLPRLTDEQFRMLALLAQQLGHPSVRDSEDFPFATDTQFLDLPQEVRDSVYFQMYSICNPTRVPDIWRCGENFFLNQEGLHGTNGLRALAITRYQLQSLANEFATLGNGQTASPELIARFTQLSEEDQIGILRQHQFLHRQSHEPIDVTRESFLGLNDSTATNEERNEAISRYLQVQISERYGSTISELTDELISLSEKLDATHEAHSEALEHLRTEMSKLRDQSRLDLASAMFHASSLQSDLDSARDQIAQLTRDVSSRDLQIGALQRQVDEAAEQQRLAREQIGQLTRISRGKDLEIAQLRVQLRQAGERERLALAEIDRLTLESGTKDSRIVDLEREALAAADRQRDALAEIDRLKRESGIKDLRIVDLERQVREATDLQRDALAEIDRLKRESGTKDLRIANLEQDVLDGAERERLARLEIDRLTLEGGTKDLRIVDLEREALAAADRQRDALAEIDRLKREGVTKDSRISDLEREDGRKDVRIGELEEIIRKLEEELRLARIDWADKERLHGVAINEKDARIDEITQEYRLMKSKKQELQEQFDKLLNESDHNDRALNARIAELEKSIRPLMTKLEETEFALQETQAKLEAGTRSFVEMKDRWLKTKKALDEATRIKAALEEESAQHAKAEQAWEKERARLVRAVESVKEEERLTGVENAGLRHDLESALQRLDAQVKDNRKLTLASEKQASELQSTIASLSDDLHYEAEKARRLQKTQQETSQRVQVLEEEQEDLLRKLKSATEEKDDLHAAYTKLEPMLQRQREEFGHEVNQIHLEADERHRALLEELERLDRHARSLEEELLRRYEPRSVPSRPAISPSNPAAAVVNEANAAASQLEEIVRELSTEPIIFSKLESSLVEGYHLNRQLIQITKMGFDKSSETLTITITDALSRELSLPRVFSLKKGHLEESLGHGFTLPKEMNDRRSESQRICTLMLIKRLQTIRGELVGAVKGADTSRATPWRTWGEVFKNFTAFCEEMNQNLPTLRQNIANYKREFARLRLQRIDEAVLKQCIATNKIPETIQEPQRGEIVGLIRLYQTMAKSCEQIFLHSLPRKIPMHHAWKILMLTNHGLPERAYEQGRLKPAEAEVVEPLQMLIPDFYQSFSSMLQSIQIAEDRHIE